MNDSFRDVSSRNRSTAFGRVESVVQLPTANESSRPRPAIQGCPLRSRSVVCWIRVPVLDRQANSRKSASSSLLMKRSAMSGGISAAAYLGITSSKLNPGAVDTVTLAGRGHGISARLSRVTIVYCCCSVSLN